MCTYKTATPQQGEQILTQIAARDVTTVQRYAATVRGPTAAMIIPTRPVAPSIVWMIDTTMIAPDS